MFKPLGLCSRILNVIFTEIKFGLSKWDKILFPFSCEHRLPWDTLKLNVPTSECE